MLLLFSAVVVALLVASSAYLHGIYGPLGKGMAMMTLLVAALVIEAFALLPLFQLRLRSRSTMARLFAALHGAPGDPVARRVGRVPHAVVRAAVCLPSAPR